MKKVLLAVVLILSFGSCADEEKFAEISLGDGKIFPGGSFSCLQIKNPPEVGPPTEDIQGPYHVSFPSMTINMYKTHALEIQSVMVEYTMPNSPNPVPCAFTKIELSALFAPVPEDDRNAAIFKNGMIVPPLDGSDSAPYTAVSISPCNLSCGGATVANPQSGFSISGEALVQGIIHYREEKGANKGDLNGEQDSFVQVVPLEITYL